MKKLCRISLVLSLVIVLVGGLILTSCTTPAEEEEEEEEEPTPIIFDISQSGNINEASLVGTGRITIVPTVGFTVEANFTDIPVSFTPCAASGGSWVCIMCCVGGCTQTYGGSETLLSIFEGDWAATVDFEIHYDGMIVGEIEQTLEATKITDYYWEASIVMNGWYSGPLDLVSSQEYSVHLEQMGPGEIEGNYVHKIFREDNTYVKNIVTRRYYYNSTNELPFPETLTTVTTDMSYVDGVLNLEGQGYYEPTS